MSNLSGALRNSIVNTLPIPDENLVVEDPAPYRHVTSKAKQNQGLRLAAVTGMVKKEIAMEIGHR
jgi:hypothetical protein